MFGGKDGQSRHAEQALLLSLGKEVVTRHLDAVHV